MATKRRKRRREPQPGPFEQIRVQATGDQVRPRRIEERVEEVHNRFIRS